jgi:broad specificity phosphatase PhoE
VAPTRWLGYRLRVDLVLIRHGEAEHSLDLPRSLELPDPHLTDTGRTQVLALGPDLDIAVDDLFVVSPTRRTLETATILRGDSNARLVVSPEVGPRMFRVDRGWLPLRCDQLMSPEAIRAEFPAGEIRRADLWPAGINTMPTEVFELLGRSFLAWCTQNARRTLIVSHDGTVYNYRKLLLADPDLPMEPRLGPAGRVLMSI